MHPWRQGLARVGGFVCICFHGFSLLVERMYFAMFSCYFALLLCPACLSVSSRRAVHVLIRRVSSCCLSESAQRFL